MSTLKTNTIKNTDDVEMYLAKAWVNFNGTGTVAIRAAGNVSSITDLGTGLYRINLSTAFTDTYYSIAASNYPEGTNRQPRWHCIPHQDGATYFKTTTDFCVLTGYQAETTWNLIDGYDISIIVFR